jgi:hypothetical protein
MVVHSTKAAEVDAHTMLLKKSHLHAVPQLAAASCVLFGMLLQLPAD